MYKYPIQGGGGVINFTPHPLSPSCCINGGGVATYHVQVSHPGWGGSNKLYSTSSLTVLLYKWGGGSGDLPCTSIPSRVGGGVINFTPHPLSPSYCINGGGEWQLTMYKYPIQGGGGSNKLYSTSSLTVLLYKWGGVATYHVQVSHPGWGGSNKLYSTSFLTVLLYKWGGEWRLTMYKCPIQGGGGSNKLYSTSSLTVLLYK